ncbi:fatty acid-binding protein DegV [Anoxybacter fermentans]|uniref:Fatty acid-binding protein DegV n=1 Tax=Anoxybacter fermentans TaxID=1323375 RepID=A0A3Q9HNW0_9FIRM|nr:DegV family protein [Anoxybacter fermentans]AZR72239.1 fatty acid-binding protein DegV [Anoxybacter fermentans]
MGKIKIFADSTCDLTPELIKENDISIVPLYVVFDEETYRDGVDITPEELYKKVDEYGKLPKTAAASPADFQKAFEPYINEGYDILYIGISSKLSSTIQNAMIAANQFPEGRIEVVDSLNLSTGIGFLVMKAVDYVKEGLSLKEIAAKIREKVKKIETRFVVDTLEYLYKGGRCSGLQNFVASMLKIRPMIKVEDGKMGVAEKIRGRRERVLKRLLDVVLKNKDVVDGERLFITHSLGEEGAKYIKEELEKTINIKDIIITDAGCVISCHCGPKTVGIIYSTK